MITTQDASRLAELYAAHTKHGNYQPVPAQLAAHLPQPRLDPLWRDPRPRLPLLQAALVQDPTGPTVVELGANTGLNTLTLAQELPGRRFVAVEANTLHAAFIEECVRLLGLDNVTVVGEGMLPEQISRRWPGSEVLDFNVAHHLGVDIAVEGVHDVATWWSHGLPRWLSTIDEHPTYWFQVGFRLGGSREHELHSPDDVDGMVNAVLSRLPERMRPVGVWCAVGDGQSVSYVEQPESLVAQRVSGLSEIAAAESSAGHFRGEYFRRPVLKLSSR